MSHSEIECAVCHDPITPGQKRVPKDWGHSSVTLHAECDIQSPVPHFQQAEYPDQIVAESDSVVMKGTVVGRGPTVDPVRGYEIAIEADQWDDLATDIVRLIHRKDQSGWGDVWLFCNNIDYDEESDEWIDDWNNRGKVRDMEILEQKD